LGASDELRVQERFNVHDAELARISDLDPAPDQF
jgi:hypothetical protein